MRILFLLLLCLIVRPAMAADPDYCQMFKKASDEENKNKGVVIDANVKAGESVVDCDKKTVTFHKLVVISQDKLKPEWRLVKLDEFNKSVCADKDSTDSMKQGWNFMMEFDFPKDDKVTIKAVCG